MISRKIESPTVAPPTIMRTIQFAIGLAVLSALSQSAMGQMEKRDESLYRLAQFVQSKPTLNETAPDLDLKTLEGKPANLKSYLGKPLVIIKGSYT